MDTKHLMAKRIHDKRVEAGLTMEELGDRLGVKKQSVGKWESGFVSNIERSRISKMASLFDVSPAWLMGFEDSNNVNLTYSAPGKDPVFVKVDALPITGPASKRAALYQAALSVKDENLDVAIQLLKSLS